MTRGSGVTVGVLDSGVDATVPDLTGSVTVGPDYTKGADPPGYQPPHLHGTYIASLIAGHGSGPGDADGVIGVAPAATILSVRVILDDQEPGFAAYHNDTAYDDAMGNGIRYAVRHGVGVINMSLGGETPSRDLRAAVATRSRMGWSSSRPPATHVRQRLHALQLPGLLPGRDLGRGGRSRRPPRVLLRPERLRGAVGPGCQRRRRGTRRKLPGRQRDEPRVGLRRRGGRADPVAVPAAQPGAGRAGHDFLGQPTARPAATARTWGSGR